MVGKVPAGARVVGPQGRGAKLPGQQPHPGRSECRRGFISRPRSRPRGWLFCRVLACGLLAVGLRAPGGLAQAQDARATLRLAGVPAEIGAGSEFRAAVVMDTTVEGVQGWSLGILHDAAVLELLGAAIGAEASVANGGSKPGFLVIRTDPEPGPGAVMAAVLNLTEAVVLPAGAGQELLTLDYRVVADPVAAAAPDPCEPIASTLFFSSALGTPPVQTIVTLEGNTIQPVTVDASFSVRCPGSIEITRCEGDTDNVYLEWEFGGIPEWDFLFLYRDGELLASLDIDATSYTDLGLQPGDYVYTLVTFVVEDPTNPTLIFTFCTGTVIPLTVTSAEPSLGNWRGGDDVTLRGTAFTSAEMTRVFLVGGEGEAELEAEVLEVVGPTEARVRTPQAYRIGLFDLRMENERGFAVLEDGFEFGFVRGEVNSDRLVDLSDAVSILTYLFLEDGVLPRCLDAADTTDDGILDISDAVRILGFLFGGGAPPAAPFPGVGRDPTTRDRFGCLETPA